MAAVTHYVSDVDAEKDVNNVKPTEFDVNGTTYSADMGDEGRKALAADLAKVEAIMAAAAAKAVKVMTTWQELGTEVKGSKSAAESESAKARKFFREDASGIAIAATRGFTVGERGAIPAEVMAAYRAHKK